MKKKLPGIIKYILFLALGIFLVWWSLHQIPDEKWPDFKKALFTARYWVVLPVFVLLITSHILRAYRWKLLMNPLGYNPSFLNTFFAVMVGYLANLAVPRLGEVLKCTILARYEKVPADKLVGTIVAERAFDVISLLLVFVFALIFQYDIVLNYSTHLFKKIFATKSGDISVVKLSVFAAIIIVIIFGVKIWFRQFAHLKIVQLFKGVLKGIWLGLSSIKSLRQKGPFILSSLGIWMLYIGGTWLGFYATVGTQNLGVPTALSSLAFASIGMIVTPGGFGAYATFMATILEKNGIPYEIGLANGNLQWFAQFLIVLIVGFISLGLLPWYNKKKHGYEKSRHHSEQNI